MSTLEEMHLGEPSNSHSSPGVHRFAKTSRSARIIAQSLNNHEVPDLGINDPHVLLRRPIRISSRLHLSDHSLRAGCI
jgi:hypothetical protein